MKMKHIMAERRKNVSPHEKEEQLKKRRNAYREKTLNCMNSQCSQTSLPLGQPISSPLKGPHADLAHDLPHCDSFQANICGPVDPSISTMPVKPQHRPIDPSISTMPMKPQHRPLDPSTCTMPPPADLQADRTLGSPYKTDAALRKAVSRIAKMQATDPDDAVKFAQVKERQLLKAMKSPRKRKTLLRSGISVGKEKVKEVSRLKSALAKVKSYVTELKTSNTKSSRLKKRTLARALCGTTPKMWLSTQTGLSRAFMLKASLIPEEEHELKQTRASTVSAEKKLEIVEFYNRPEIRVVTPDRKQTTMGQERGFLNRTLTSLHCDYKQESGSMIGRTTFQKLRPKTTLCVDQAKHTSCLCEYCTNVALKLSVFKADHLLYTKQWQMHTLSKNIHQPKPVCFDALSLQLNKACTYADLEVVCRQHSHLASQHPMGTASLSAADPVVTPDVNAASVFPKDSPRLTPLAIVGDGNGLPRCASVLVYGNQDHHAEMRARIILELVLAQECYLDESFLQMGCQGSNVLATYSMFSGQVVPTPFVQNSAQSVLREEIMEMRFPYIHCTRTLQSSSFGSTFTEEYIPDKDQRKMCPWLEYCGPTALGNSIPRNGLPTTL